MAPRVVQKKIEEIAAETGQAFTTIGQNACGNSLLYDRMEAAADRNEAYLHKLDTYIAAWRKSRAANQSKPIRSSQKREGNA